MESSNLIFTEYVRSIEPGVEPPLEDFEAVWRKLRDALRHEMKQRSVWSASPSCLGIIGFQKWALEALEDLTVDCYVFVFIRRLPGLTAMLEGQENIEGVVFRNIRNFLFEKQKHHDPVGYRTFKVLRIATRQSITAGELHVLYGDARVSNATILGFRLDVDPLSSVPLDLSRPAEAWSEDLLPQLITARGAELDRVVARLREDVAELPEVAGAECFQFQQVIGPFKSGVRRRWNAIWIDSQGELAYEEGDEDSARLVRAIRPDSGFEEREAFGDLVRCVSDGLEHLEKRPKTLNYLDKLWTFLRSRIAEDVPENVGAEVPSRRKIAELLDIPRYRLPALHETLSEVVTACQAAPKGDAS